MSSLQDSTPEDDPALREALKRCSPATYYAACKFRKAGRAEDLRTVILGVIERFVERDLRPQLLPANDTLRIREDLGIDSLTMMEIVMVAEDVLRISVSNDELSHLRTLGEVQAFILSKASSPAAANTQNKTCADNGGWDLTVLGEEVRQIEANAARSITRLSN